ncbi:MAG: tRNA (N(6)-L-threonylcarbamoyladenosine(37)-C(2))-methylthiotransferase MtaB [Pseudomonadota bacterium]
MEQKTVAIQTLGCRLNIAESGSLASDFEERGYRLVPFGEKADFTILNTCTVTNQADADSRNLIRKAKRHSPMGRLVVMGCYAQVAGEKIAQMPEVDMLLGNEDKFKLFQFLDQADETKQEQLKIVETSSPREFWGAATTTSDEHTRAFLKIQDGCNYVCSYCIIPQARGPARATSIVQALTQAKKLASQGFKEIVLTGVNIGEYHSASGEKLENLVAQLLEVDGLERLRLSSVEPNTITEELIRVLKASSKSMDHFHVPLQSGDDQILQAMRRHYNAEEYSQKIYRLKEAFPQAGIGADVLVGFPGEEGHHFQNTLELVKKLPISHLHIFPFSKRSNTLAAKMDHQIPATIRRERVKALMVIAQEKLAFYAQQMIGKVNQVLLEQIGKSELWEGYTTNYFRSEIEGDPKEFKENEIVKVKIMAMTTAGRLSAKLEN